MLIFFFLGKTIEAFHLSVDTYVPVGISKARKNNKRAAATLICVSMFDLGVSSKAIQKARQTAKRNRTSAACSRCKAGKIKCSDYRPCKQCTTSRITCEDAKRPRASSNARIDQTNLIYRTPEEKTDRYRTFDHAPYCSSGIQHAGFQTTPHYRYAVGSIHQPSCLSRLLFHAPNIIQTTSMMTARHGPSPAGLPPVVAMLRSSIQPCEKPVLPALQLDAQCLQLAPCSPAFATPQFLAPFPPFRS